MRTKRGQKTHDQKVNQWANWLKGSGKKVLADLPGYDRPDPISGRIPDVMVKVRGKITVVGEVETPSTVKSDQSQQNSLKRGANGIGADFRLKVAREKRGR